MPKKNLIDGGYITLENTTPQYHYYLKDHLGNNRVVVNIDGTVEQVNHYYPFGGLFGESTGGSVQWYKYNGKEFDRTNGLDWYDYGARHMAPDVGRFTSIDPLAEKYYSISPYVYCMDNPVKHVDPDGKEVNIIYQDHLGRDRIFHFNGFNGLKTIKVPNNQFILDFIKAYKYNTKNGGGKNIKEAVENNKYSIYLIEASSIRGKTEFIYDEFPVISWE